MVRFAPLPRAPSAREERLFAFLLDVNARYNLNLTLRVAGGWVRDMLLGMESHDIDIAIDGPAPPGATDGEAFMTGARFAEFIQQRQVEAGEDARSFGVVKANPDQSKHLETATTRVCDIDVDLVHLRKEDYASDSRIPVTTRATPEEDALRRDLTINALFYNLDTKVAEDFTGRGLDDLQAKYVRTPLPPVETFRDDPLRLLRCIRFACRLGFTLDPAIPPAAREILDDLERKVSRERVGIEVAKMLEGPDPARAVRVMAECGVRDAVFSSQLVDKKKAPEGPRTPLPWTAEGWTRSQRLIDQLAASALFAAEADKELRQVMTLAAVLREVAPAMDASVGGDAAASPINDTLRWVEGVVTHSLKLPTRITTGCAAVLWGSRTVLPLLAVPLRAPGLCDDDEPLRRFLAPGEGIGGGRVQVGQWIRHVGAAHWRPAVLLGCCAADPTAAACPPLAAAITEAIAASGVAAYADLKAAIRGDLLQRQLGLPKGPTVGVAMGYLLKLQMAYPSFTEDELLAWLRERRDDIIAEATAIAEATTKRPRN